jgi:hypothetical protein
MKMEEDIVKILNYIGKHISRNLNKQINKIDSPEDFEELFSKESLEKPLILRAGTICDFINCLYPLIPVKG